ncbi:hypothetical protein MYXA107069_35165 [Myxococcus xanthus]|nr:MULTISPECIES: hypothetical protein [Myxococcus]QZZ48345.1 hypothetical protein MyxoNM_03985 [Myxococcus xanthus]UYI15467.1 hypothetical protein N3T43_03970 [Myxococcus xanthus]UYI22830.1 hypothetical protein N1129_03970 [Myxococcus xanthus]SDW52617.1 hypothetical protein SAMN05444383_102510 [Myxococcus xanthus]
MRLESLLEALTDRHLADRLERVHRAAAVAIDRLGHLSIAKYEPTSVEADGGADLSLWETMAPAIGDTLVGVNQLISAVHQEFPPPTRPVGLGDGGWAPPPASSDERLAQEVEAVLHAIADRLARRVAELGQQMRRPEVVSDRWTLMAELQSFRADFRVRIGDLVYLTASAFADVRREEVVPGYAHQLGARAALRAAAADLRRSLQGRLERAAKAEARARPSLARQVAESLSAFVSLPASVALRTPQKHQVLELRARLLDTATQSELAPDALPELVEPYLTTLDEQMEEVTRTWLVVHDRAMWATCGMKLEQADMHLTLGSRGAERVLAEAVEAAGALQGRSAPFDAFLRKARQEAGDGLDEAGARELLGRFRERLAALPFS